MKFRDGPCQAYYVHNVDIMHVWMHLFIHTCIHMHAYIYKANRNTRILHIYIFIIHVYISYDSITIIYSLLSKVNKTTKLSAN